MNSFKLSLIVQILFTLIVLSGCSEDTNPIDSTGEPYIDGNTYINPEHNFRISAPEGWSLTKDAEVGGINMLLMGEADDPSYLQSSFNIIAQYTGSTQDMSVFLPAAKQTIEGMFDEVEFYSDRIIDAGGLECCELVFKMSLNGASLVQRQLYFFSSNSIIVITFSSLSSLYMQASQDFDTIQNSLRSIR